MVRRTLSLRKALMLAAMSGLMFSTGCSSNKQPPGPDLAAYRDELKKTADMESMEVGSRTERDAVKRFKDFYAVYSPDAVRNGIRDVYDDEAWFGDPYHTVKGIDALEAYFLLMAEAVESCTFTIDAVQRSGKEFYFHWTMNLVSKAAKDKPVEAIGMSHVRFNRQGMVVFQQDYWDTSAMLDRLPVVGYWTRLVKGRITKGLSE